MHARAHNSQKKGTVIYFNNCACFLLLRARTCTDHQEKKDLVDMYTDNLSFKFHEDPFIGSREIAETKSSMHISHF